MSQSFINGDEFRQTQLRTFVLPYRTKVAAVLHELSYCDILYRRLIIQLIFDLIIDYKRTVIISEFTPFWEREIKDFIRGYPNAKLSDLTTDELIESAEELSLLFYQYYRHEIRDHFEASPRIDYFEVKSFGIFFRVTTFLG